MGLLTTEFVEASPLLIAAIDQEMRIVSLSSPWREVVGDDLTELSVDGLFQEVRFTKISDQVADVLKTKSFIKSLAVT